MSRLLDASAVPDGRSLDLTLVLEYIDQDLSTYLSKVTAPGLSRDCIKVRTQLSFCQNKSTVGLSSTRSLRPIINIQPENWKPPWMQSYICKTNNSKHCDAAASVCAGCDAAAAARTGLPAHEHGAAPWPKTREHPGQQPRRSQDRRLWTGSHLHLQHRSDSWCKWGSTQTLFREKMWRRLFCYKYNNILFCLLFGVVKQFSFVLPPSPLAVWPPSVCSGGDAVVQSSWGAAQLCLHVLSGHVERRLHLRRALPLEVRRAQSASGWRRYVTLESLILEVKTHSAVVKIASWCLFSCRPLFRGYTEVQQLQKIFEWVLFVIYVASMLWSLLSWWIQESL